MRDLFVINLFAVVLKFIIDKIPRIWFIIISLLWLFNIEIPVLFISGSTLVFFSLGYYVVKYNIHFQDFTKNRKPLIISGYLFFVVLNIILNNYADDTIVWKIILNMNHAVMIVFGLAFFVLIAIGICGRSGTHIAEEKNSRIFNLLLKYNFSIYLFHELTLTICRKTVLKIFGSTALVQFASFFILPVIVIAWCILVSIILEKLCPKVFSLITGKRSKKVLN